MSSLTLLGWFVVIGVFAVTVLVDTLLTLALSRAKERLGRGRAVSEVALHRRKVLGQGCGRTSGGHAADVAVESDGVGGHRYRAGHVTLDEQIQRLVPASPAMYNTGKKWSGVGTAR